MCWIEHGGPTVQPPARRGFGQVVIERTVARALGGSVVLEFPPEGLRWTLTFPADLITAMATVPAA
jgi:two-component sensor histidine kinase